MPSTAGIEAFYAGSKPVERLYAGSSEVWSSGGGVPVTYLAYSAQYNSTLTLPAVAGGILEGDVAVVLSINTNTVPTVGGVPAIESTPVVGFASVHIVVLSPGDTTLVTGTGGYHMAMLFRGVDLDDPIAAHEDNGANGTAGRDVTALVDGSMNVQWLHFVNGGSVLVSHVDNEGNGWLPVNGNRFATSSGPDGIITGSYLPVDAGETFGADLTHQYLLRNTAIILNPAT